jgi:cell division protein ZapE
MRAAMTDLPTLYAARIAAGSLHADPDQDAVLPEFERIRAAVTAPVKRGLFRKPPAPPKGLYLWGGVGRGKSMLMDLFVDTLDGVPTRRVHFHAFMQEIHTAMHAARQSGVQDALAPVAADVARQARVLAFDEMQITDITDAMIVGRLFQSLLAAGTVIVTTSNRVPDDLYKDGLNRQLFLPFIQLIRDHMAVWHLTGPTDHRQNRLQGDRVWFSPIGPPARTAIDTIWRDLTGGRSEPLTLNVKGRALIVEKFHNSVARMNFYDLCGRYLGPADYLALAAELKVLILEDIPCLSRSNFNEAKRFVTLIDTLYEARVRLVCSAAAEPEMLYLEGEGTFEFTRTASRLREMQDATWGA